MNDSTYAPVYLATDKGFFKDEDLNVKLVVFRSGSDLVKGVASGSVDIGVTALAGVMNGVQQGQPLKVFYGGFNAPIFSWWAKQSIDSVKAGKGKSWGVTRVGSSTDFLTRYLLNQHGLSPKDVNIVSGGAGASRLAAMKAGQLQIDIASEPWATKYKRLGYNLIAKQSDVMDSYPDHVSFARASFLQDNSSTAEAFLRALVKGFKLTKSNPEAAQQAIAKHVKIDQSLAKAAYQSFIDYQHADGRLPNKKAMSIFWKIGISNDQFQKRIPRSEWLVTKWMDNYPKWVK